MPLGQSTLIVSVRSLSANIADRQDEDSQTVLSPDMIRWNWDYKLLKQADMLDTWNEITAGTEFDDALPQLTQAVEDHYGSSIFDDEAYSLALLNTHTHHNFLVCNITATGNSDAKSNNRSDRAPNGQVIRYRPNRCKWRTDIDLNGIDQRGNPKTYTEADLLDPDVFVDLCVRVSGGPGTVNNKLVVRFKNGPPT